MLLEKQGEAGWGKQGGGREGRRRDGFILRSLALTSCPQMQSKRCRGSSAGTDSRDGRQLLWPPLG